MSSEQDRGREAQQPRTYRFVAACKTCGIVGEETLTPEEMHANFTGSYINEGEQHYHDTGHTVVSANYTNAPENIQEMLEADDVEGIDFRELSEYVTNTGEYA